LLVLGCGMGGPGDIPGGDYCYHTSATSTEDTATTTANTTTSSGTGSSGSSSGGSGPTTPQPLPSSPSLAPSLAYPTLLPTTPGSSESTASSSGGPLVAAMRTPAITDGSSNGEMAMTKTGSKSIKAPSLELEQHVSSDGESAAAEERTRQHDSTHHER
jgi:hypothetical protein